MLLQRILMEIPEIVDIIEKVSCECPTGLGSTFMFIIKHVLLGFKC